MNKDEYKIWRKRKAYAIELRKEGIKAFPPYYPFKTQKFAVMRKEKMKLAFIISDMIKKKRGKFKGKK